MANVGQFREVHVNVNNTAIMPANTNFSSIFDCGGTTVCAIKFDSQLENKTITFYVNNQPSAPINDTITPYYDAAGSLISINVPTIPANTYAVIQLPPALFAGVRFIQLVASNVVPQDSTIEFFTRPV